MRFSLTLESRLSTHTPCQRESLKGKRVSQRECLSKVCLFVGLFSWGSFEDVKVSQRESLKERDSQREGLSKGRESLKESVSQRESLKGSVERLSL